MSRSGYRPALFASFVLSDAQVMFRLVGELWSGVYFASWHEVPGEPGADQVGAAIVAQDASLRGRESFASLGGAAMMLAVEGLRRAGRDLSREGFVSALETIDDWTPELGFRVRFGPGRRHSGNRLRLLRTGASAREVAVVSGYQEFEPLF
jgi:branched-chain amino acid transport system substrate-binding protein